MSLCLTRHQTAKLWDLNFMIYHTRKKNVVLRKQFLVRNHVTRRPKNLHENEVQFPKEKDGSVLHHQHGPHDVTCKPAIKTESIRKLSNFNFQLTKTLYQNNLKHIVFFFTFFKDYTCNQLCVITPKKICYGGPRKFMSNLTK